MSGGQRLAGFGSQELAKRRKKRLGESDEKAMTGFCWLKELMSRRGRSQGDGRWDAENGWLLGLRE